MKNRRAFFVFLVSFFLWQAAVFAQARPRALVVYYSRDGHTHKVASALAKRFEADTQRLIDKKKRTGPVGASAAGKDAIAGSLTRIQPLEKNPLEYEVILIGTPSWFSNPAPAVRTFVKRYPLKGKKVALFGTAHLTGIEACLSELSRLVQKEGGEVLGVLPLRHKDLEEPALSKKIEEFYQRVTDSR